ncbi:MAG: diacylglycerol kinase, partial [Aeromonas sobria]
MAKPGATGVTRIINATGYSMKGLKSAWINEAAFRQELMLILLLMPLAFWVGDSLNQILLLITISWLVVIVEI